MSGGSQMGGIVGRYADMTPIPGISYDQTKNALVFNHHLQTTKGIASSESEILEFKPPCSFQTKYADRVQCELIRFPSNAITV